MFRPQGAKVPQLYIEDVPQMRASAGPSPCARRGTTGRLCDWQVLGKDLITISRPVKFVLAGGSTSTFLHFGSSQSRLLISEMWGRCFFLILRENPVTHPIKAPQTLRTPVTCPIKSPQTLSFLYLNFHNRTLGKPRKNVSPNAQGKSQALALAQTVCK